MKDNIPDSLLIIMVVFRRALADCEAFQSILKLVDDQEKLNLFVYDNSPSPQDVGIYKGMDIVYTHDPENSGVSMHIIPEQNMQRKAIRNGYCFWIRTPHFRQRF